MLQSSYRLQYVGWSSEDAVKHYLSRMSAKIPHFETMEEPELNYIKVETDYLQPEHNLMV